MTQLAIRGAGVLLVLLISWTAAQNSSAVQPTAAAGGDFTFDCRRGNDDVSCGNSSTCDLNTGTCNCMGIADPNYKCDWADGSTCSPACSNGFCQSGKCNCDQSHYGSDCSLERVQIICNGESMLVNINPMDNFAGSIYAQADPACKLEQNSSYLTNSVFKDQIPADMEGWSRTFSADSSDCSNAFTTGQDGITVKTYIQYNRLFKSSVDQIVTAKCSSNDNTTISSNVTNIGDSDNGVNQVTVDGKLDSVTVSVTGKSLQPLVGPVYLGDEIHLIFVMKVNASSAYRDFTLLQCWANNGSMTPDYRFLTFLTAGCPEPQAKSLFAGLPTKSVTRNEVKVDVTLKAFMFIGSSKVVFVCSVAFCKVVNGGNCNQISCPGYSSSAPVDSGQLNNTSDASASTARRKRETISSQVSAAVTVKDRNDNSPSGTEPVTERPAVSGVCSNDEDIIAVIAILGVCVFMLLITTIMLIICMKKSTKKPDPGHSDRYSRTVESIRYPRLEMNGMRNDSC